MDIAATAAYTAPDWTIPPRYCPYCGGSNIEAINEDCFVSYRGDDSSGSGALVEYQCAGQCEGRSFWV